MADGPYSPLHIAGIYLGITLGNEAFTDFDFADGVALLSEMLEILILSLETLQQESSQLGLEINWNKTKIQTTDLDCGLLPQLSVQSHAVEAVECFISAVALTHQGEATVRSAGGLNWLDRV